MAASRSSIETSRVVEAGVEAGAIGREISRRSFHGYVVAALSSFLGMVLGLPVIGYVTAPLAIKVKASWISLGRAESYSPGTPRLVSFSIMRQDGWREIAEARTCWVAAQGNNQFVVFNGRCTHLGCAYSWRAEGEHANHFVCPCHDGVYDASGTVVAGPPPRPLDRLETKIDGGELFVLYQDFRLGIPTKEPL